MNRLHGFIILFLCCLTAGCASLTPQNKVSENYRVDTSKQKDWGEVILFLAFSGGGTRASALSYGVLEELRDTTLLINDKNIRLLDEVDRISAVSGGSFTAAYYGLYGDKIFEDYTEIFLEKNIQKNLIWSLFNPANWFKALFTGFNRTEHAIEYYDKHIFNGATFADLLNTDGPEIEINATDLSTGHRFSFIPLQFDLICSDLTQLNIARAVAASSAVPVAFAPVLLKNYSGDCSKAEFSWLDKVDPDDPYYTRKKKLFEDMRSYQNAEKRPYIHLVDGGISDNLGLHALIDRIIIVGGPKRAVELSGSTSLPKTVIVILVNAETEPEKSIDLSPKKPPLSEVVSAVSKTQITRYNIETISLIKESMAKWADELSTENIDIEPHFIEVSFKGIKTETTRNYFNNISTTLALPSEEVDQLRDAGRTLLRESPEFQELIEDFH